MSEVPLQNNGEGRKGVRSLFPVLPFPGSEFKALRVGVQ